MAWQDSDILYAAEHFDLIDMDFNGSRTDVNNDYYRYASLIQGNHSDIKILGYKDAVYMNPLYDDYAAADESWFMRTETAENAGPSNDEAQNQIIKIVRLHPSASVDFSAHSNSFNGTGERLSVISVEMLKVGTPNALIKCALYAHSGTYGTSSVPTGDALEVSPTTINTTTLTGSFVYKNFTFSGTTTLTLGTYYTYIVYADSGTIDSSNYIRLAYSATGYGGNTGDYYSSSWHATTINDHRFKIYTETGNDYIYSAYWGCYLMDVSNAGWQQHFADYVNTKIAQGTGTAYDGVFVDDVWEDVSDYSGGFNGTVPAAKVASWKTDMSAFLTHLNTDVTGIVLVNSDEFNTDDYLDLVDGQMLEGYVHASWDNSTTWDSTHLNLGTAHHTKSQTGKIIFCSSGSSDYNEPILNMCYNNFVNNSTDLEHSYFAFNGYASSDPHFEYYEIMDTPLAGGVTPPPTQAPFTGDVNGPEWSGSLAALGVGLTIFLVVFAPLVAERRRR